MASVGYPTDNVTVADSISKLRHRDCLDLLERLTKAGMDRVLSEPTVASLVPIVGQIYEHRNDYLHDLELPQGEAWLSIENERRIQEWITLFTEYGTPPSWSVILSRLFYANSRVREFLKANLATTASEQDNSGSAASIE
jgi:hypothetical protein